MDHQGPLKVSIALAVTADPQLSARVLAALDAGALRDIGHAFVLDLQSMRFGAWRDDVDVYPASIIKVPIMAEVFHQYAEGTIAPSDPITVAESNQTTTWGVSPFAPGVVTTVDELVERMVTHSDNVATNQLIDVVRRERVTAFMHELGLQTFLLGRKLSGSEPLIEDNEIVGRNRLPPNEIGALLALIATDTIPGASKQRQILKRCVHAEKLVPGLREGDVFMHKTGETSAHSHDAGILRTAEGKAYVIVLYSAPEPKSDNSDADHVNPQMTEWMRSLRAVL